MRILIDTNIFIYRENDHVLPANLEKLLKILNVINAKTLIHPKSVEELRKDLNEGRKEIALSKIKTYSLLESPPNPDSDANFLNLMGHPSNTNDYVDNAILYSVHRDAVDFLITEDKGIQKKSNRLGIKDRVLYIDEALRIFGKNIFDERVSRPPALKEEFVYNLNIYDSFFDSLKRDYNGFETWFKERKKEGRKCWVYFKEGGSIGALLVYKVESEPIDSVPPLPAKKRLKLSTFQVTHTGYKIGELFIKLAVEYCIKNNFTEIYFTHFTKPDDYLADLVTEYGFYKAAKKRNGEDIYVKELLPDREKVNSLQPIEISKIFYPAFYDGLRINKFIIPIRPEYHQRLFTDYKERQTTISEHLGEFIIEGNTIKKAYLSHSRNTKISPGDILLFYRSNDKKEITSSGVVEKVFFALQNKDDIIKHVGKRTVYSVHEIEKMAEKPTVVILFTWHLHLANPLKLSDLKEMNIFAPQSILLISHEKYLLIKSKGGIDERFTVH
jgi:rRNA-processing protein FCF1